MGKMKDLVLDIQEEILHGFLSFQGIADKYQVPVSWVEEVVNEMVENGCELMPEPTLQECLDFDAGKEMAKDQYIIENDYQDEF